MQRYEFFTIFVLSKQLNMEQNVIQKNMWNTAARAGLILGLVSTVYIIVNSWTGRAEIPAFLSILINGAVWCLKFGGCIWLMRFFMKKFVSENPEADNSRTFRLGVAMAILSALVFAAYTLAGVAFISTDHYTEQMEAVMQQMGPMLDSNSLAQVDSVMQNLPKIAFFSNLIYCILYGTVLSAIHSRNIPSKDPFAGYKPQE